MLMPFPLDLKKQNADLKEERDMYRNIASQLQNRIVPERNPFGVIGSSSNTGSFGPNGTNFVSAIRHTRTVGTEGGMDEGVAIKTEEDGKAAELEKQNAQLKDMLRNYGHSL